MISYFFISQTMEVSEGQKKIFFFTDYHYSISITIKLLIVVII